MSVLNAVGNLRSALEKIGPVTHIDNLRWQPFWAAVYGHQQPAMSRHPIKHSEWHFNDDKNPLLTNGTIVALQTQFYILVSGETVTRYRWMVNTISWSRQDVRGHILKSTLIGRECIADCSHDGVNNTNISITSRTASQRVPTHQEAKNSRLLWHGCTCRKLHNTTGTPN